MADGLNIVLSSLLLSIVFFKTNQCCYLIYLNSNDVPSQLPTLL